MTAIEANVRFLLLAVLAEIELLAEVPDDASEAGDPFVAAMCRDGVPFAPALWVGQPLPAARRMAFFPAARRLADRGLARTRWGRTLLLEAKSHQDQAETPTGDAKTDLGRRGREQHPQADRNGRSAVNLFPRRR